MSKTITLEQLKDAARYVFQGDLTDYDNWVGFTHFVEDVWKNLDKRIGRAGKHEMRRRPPKYEKFVTLPLIGALYRCKNG